MNREEKVAVLQRVEGTFKSGQRAWHGREKAKWQELGEWWMKESGVDLPRSEISGKEGTLPFNDF